MARRISIGLVQLGASRSKDEAVRRVERLVRSIEDEVDILVFPEYAMMDPTGLDAEAIYNVSESLEGPWVSLFRRIASERGSCIITTMFERGSRGKAYNTAVLIDSSGDVGGIYRKTHLFDVLGYRESDFLEAGESLTPPIEACGLRIGIAICFEIRYPEVFRFHALNGADLVVVPSGWYRGDGKEEALRVLAQARAHENVMYIAVPVLYGERFIGRSMLVNPLGIVEVDAGHGERVSTGYIDVGLIEEARRKMPLLQLMRRDIYTLSYSSTGTSSYVR